MEDSFSSLSSTSTLSCDPLIIGGSADLESGVFSFPPSSTRTTTTTSALSFSDVNPYAGTASSLGARNRRWPHRRFFHEASEFDLKQQHFLDSCFLCKKPLSGNRDIFMYRGDLPFCSEECRQQQIEMDEEQEGAKAAALRALSRRELQKEEPRSSPKGEKARAGSIQLAG